MTTEHKHTSGPWRPSQFGCQVVTGDSWSTICTLSGGAQWEDGRGNYGQEYEWQQQEANARLIAAAPDMLEVLVRIRDSFPGYIPDFVEAVNAAIDKATSADMGDNQ